MPLYKIILLYRKTKLYLFGKLQNRITTFSDDVRLKDTSLARLKSMKSESHQKGFLAVRKLLQHIDYTDFDLYYDEFGKPHLKLGCK